MSLQMRLAEGYEVSEDQQIIICLHGKSCFLSENKISNKALTVARKKVSKEEWIEFSWIKIDKVHSDFFISLSLKK